MCMTIPGKIIHKQDTTVIVEYLGETREASSLFYECEVGDYVIVSAGLVVKKLCEEEAIEAINTWKELLEND